MPNDATLIILGAENVSAHSAVKINETSGRHRWGYIYKTGKLVIDLYYTDAWAFSDGVAKVAFSDSTGGWIGAIAG